MNKSAQEKNLVAKLRLVEERRRIRQLATLGAYAIKIGEFFTLPFFAPSDGVAIDCATRLISDEHLESTLPEIYCVGEYCTLDGKFKPLVHRFLPFQLIARPLKRSFPSAPETEGHNKGAPKQKKTVA